MNRVEKTIDLQMNGGLNCAQAIITVYGEPFGISPATAKTLGRPWGGGMAQQAKTCGYLTGAMIVLALAYNNGDEEASRKETGQAIRDLFRQVEKRRGSTLCKDLLGADMSTPEGKKTITEKRLIKTVCCNQGGIGQDVAEILEDLIARRSPSTE